ncbi:MAG TPA: carboxypeptidase regulatory-like domain-containing protein [Cyclobacteriaceae bacterium]|nr:carboxypeptidase regulatory-like domain-containing protein [Cyclobacteriaceae bacterium]
MKNTLEGIVKDEFGGVLDSVNCVVSSASFHYSTLTDEFGKFRTPKINTGKYSVTISKPNYSTRNTEVEVKANPTIVEFVLSSDSSFLRLSDSTLNVNYLSASKEILVEANTSWTISSDASWLKVSTNQGSGNQLISVTWQETREDNSRIGMISLRSKFIERKLKVFQSPPLKLLNVNYFADNKENESLDSISLQFTKPVADAVVLPNGGLLNEEINYKINRNILTFPYEKAKLGDEHLFSVSVYDGPDLYNFEFTAQFYTAKLNLPGYVVDYTLSDDNKIIWAVTQYPNKVFKISVPDLMILREQNLDFEPLKIKWNSFQNKLNIFDAAPGCNCEEIAGGNCKDNYLLYFDPDDFSVGKSEIKMIEGYDDDCYRFGDPYVFPKDICLLANGTGLIKLADRDLNLSWRFIDSNHFDSTFISGSNTDIRYEGMHVNYDRSKIYVHDQASVYVFEPEDSTFRQYNSPFTGQVGFIIPHKKKNLLYHHEYPQFISDGNGYISYKSYIQTVNQYNEAMDFSYKADEEQSMYYLKDGLFQIMDYERALTTLKTDAIIDLTNIRSATDGVYFTAIKRNDDGSTDFFIFDTSIISNKIPTSDSAGRIRSNNTDQSLWMVNSLDKVLQSERET